MEVVKICSRRIWALAIILIACNQNPDFAKPDQYPNNDKIIQIGVLKNKVTGKIEHRMILYKDSSYLRLSYDKNGDQTDSCFYDINNNEQGVCKVTIETGGFEYLEYKDGKMNGFYKRYDDKLKLREEGKTINNLANDIWKSYYPSGGIQSFEYFNSKGKIFQREYSKDGQILSDEGSPISIFHYQENEVGLNEYFSAWIEVVTPPKSYLRIFELSNSDSTKLSEIPIEGNRANFSREVRNPTDTNVIVEWKLFDLKTDTMQLQGRGRYGFILKKGAEG